jgi:hypothetical protein
MSLTKTVFDDVIEDPGKMKWTCRNCGPMPVAEFHANHQTLCKKCKNAVALKRKELKKRLKENNNNGARIS